MSNEPYIKRLERQRDVLIDALKAIEEWYLADARCYNTAYPGDAKKEANRLKLVMNEKVVEAKKQLGGLYA